jgi:hypothetical protein
MNDRPNVPNSDEDPELDGALRALGRFSPRQGFAERVVARVRVPLPHWARRIRDWFRGTFTGVTGWTVLTTFSLATAAAWGTAIVAGVRYGDIVVNGVSLSAGEVLQVGQRVAAELLAGPVAESATWAQQWSLAVGLPLGTLAVGYGILAVFCAVALWRLMAEPARAKGTINVVR